MLSDSASLQSTSFGLALMPVIPPSRRHLKRSRMRITSPPATLQVATLPTPRPSAEKVLSPKASDSSLLPKVQRRSTAQASYSLDLSGTLQEMTVEELRTLLTNALILERDLIDSLKSRINLLSRALHHLEATPSISVQDISQLTAIFHEISASLSNTCIVESELGVRQRELEKRNLEISLLKRKMSTQSNAFQLMQAENKGLKEKMKELQDENAHLMKVHHTEKQKFASFYSKIDALEEGMKVLTATASSQNVDAVTKLKSAIGALLRELREEKGEVAAKNKHITDLNTQIQKLNKKALRLSFKLNEIRNRKSSLAEQNQSLLDDGLGHRRMNDPRTLSYRLSDLKPEQREFIVDLTEHGVQAAAHLQDASKMYLVESMADKLVQLNEFVEQFNLLRPALESIAKSEDIPSLVAAINSDIPLIANSERCFYWIFDHINDEVWTVKSGHELKFAANTGLVGAALRSGVFINTRDTHRVDQSAFEHALGYQLQSALVYPVANSEQVIVGVLEVINNFVGKFDHDEEYLVEVLLPVIAQTTGKVTASINTVKLNRMKDDLLKAVPSLCLCETKQRMENQVEILGCRVFAVEKCRLLLVEGTEFVTYSNGSRTTLSRAMGICGEVSRSHVPEIVADPYSDIRYNSLVDISSSLPVYFSPVIDWSTGLPKVVGVLQVPHKSAVRAKVNERSVRVDSGIAALVDQFAEVISACVQRMESSKSSR